MRPPAKDTLSTYYQSYYGYLKEADLLAAIKLQLSETEPWRSVATEMETFSYAPGKWNIRELIGHLIDTERIFSYRILRLARKDATPLAGFDENEYAEKSRHGQRSLAGLVDEWRVVRSATVALLETLEDGELDFEGTANNTPVTARKLAFMVYAHAEHHMKVLRERYLA